MFKVEKLLVVFCLVICVTCGQQVDYTYDDYSDKEHPTESYEPKPVEEEEVVTKIYYTVGQTSTLSIVEPISCHFQDKWYREGEEFRMGPNNCSICMCVDTDVRCNDDECLTEMPENVESEVKTKKNFNFLTPRQKLKVPEINTTVASLIPENYPDLPESDNKLDYDHAIYMDYDDNDKYIYVEVPKQFTCIYEGKSFREDEEFKSGPDGCLHCVCINNEVNCKNVNCPYPVAAIALESRKAEQKVFINATALSGLIQMAENKIKKFVGVRKFEDLMKDLDRCEY